MALADKLEKRAKELHRMVQNGLPDRYCFKFAADRELLEQAAKRIRELEYKHHYV